MVFALPKVSVIPLVFLIFLRLPVRVQENDLIGDSSEFVYVICYFDSDLLW